VTESYFEVSAFAIAIAFAYLIAFDVFDRTASAVVIICLISLFQLPTAAVLVAVQLMSCGYRASKKTLSNQGLERR
jgi:hypothetical protein